MTFMVKPHHLQLILYVAMMVLLYMICFLIMKSIMKIMVKKTETETIIICPLTAEWRETQRILKY